MLNLKYFSKAMIPHQHLPWGARVAGCLLGVMVATVISAQSPDDFEIPSHFKVEGIPPIKKFEVEHLFYDPAAIRSNLIWDADRRNRRLLVTDETNNIYLVSSPLAQPIKLIDKMVPNSVKVRPDGKAFAFTSDKEDEDNFQLYLYEFEKKSSSKLIKLAGKDESIESFVWSRDGGSLYFSKVDYDTKVSRICTFLQSETCFAKEFRGIWDVLDVSKNKLLLKYWKASSGQHLYVLDVETNRLFPIDEEGTTKKASFAANRIVWTTEGNKACKADPCILSHDLGSKKTIQLALPRDIGSVNDIKISPNGKNLLLQETVNGVDRLRIFRLAQSRLDREMSSFIKGSFVIWNIRWISENEVAYTLENLGKPASVQTFNLDSKRVEDWTKERLPTQLEGKVSPPEIVKWRSFDQQEITGYMVRPTSAEGRTPVLIYIHGGPQILDKPVFNSQDIRLSSQLGVAIIHANIRGSSGFGSKFMDADNGERRIDAVRDVQALIDWIDKRPDLDAERIFIRGGSYGGFIALSTALREPTRVKGVIAEYPLVSIRGMLSQSWVDEFAKNEYGDPKDEALMLKLDQLSPLNNSDKWNKIPVLLTRGKKDSRNPEKDLTDLKTQLEKGGSDVWFIYSNTDGHGFGGKYVFAAIYKFLETQTKKRR